MRAQLTVGDTAPNFSLPSSSGTITLKSLAGKQVVLYFYPKDDTPGCTKQACGFRDEFTGIEKANTVVLGVSTDDLASHQRFSKKYSLPFTLLSDEKAEVSKAYGVYKEKSMYGKTYWGIERSTFVIDETGRLKAVFRKVKVDGHVQEVMDGSRALKDGPPRHTPCLSHRRQWSLARPDHGGTRWWPDRVGRVRQRREDSEGRPGD